MKPELIKSIQDILTKKPSSALQIADQIYKTQGYVSRTLMLLRDAGAIAVHDVPANGTTIFYRWVKYPENQEFNRKPEIKREQAVVNVRRDPLVAALFGDA